MPVLARAWQMLLKGVEEVQTAPSAKQAAEMLLVRLAFVADLPVPAELVRSIDLGVPAAVAPAAVPAASASKPAIPAEPVLVEPFATPVAVASPSAAPPAPGAPRRSDNGNAVPIMAAPEMVPPVAPPQGPGPQTDPMPRSFDETIALFATHGEVITSAQLRSQVHLVAFEPGRIEFRPAGGAPRDLANRLGQRLFEWTGVRWGVVVSSAEGAPTLEQQAQSRDSEIRSQVAQHPLVRAVLDAFPGATIAAVRERFAAPGPAGEEAAPAEDETASSDEDEP
jgi:DNA polymerase-3 subunit gamma/tau